MQKIILMVGLLIGCISLYAQEYSVNVSAKWFKSSDGVAIIRVFNSKKGFPNNESLAYKVEKCAINNNQCLVTLKLPAGTYAIAIIHDENSNDELDKNWAGMPIESIGLSNFQKLGKPSFDKSKVYVNRDLDVSIKIQSLF